MHMTMHRGGREGRLLLYPEKLEGRVDAHVELADIYWVARVVSSEAFVEIWRRRRRWTKRIWDGWELRRGSSVGGFKGLLADSLMRGTQGQRALE